MSYQSFWKSARSSCEACSCGSTELEILVHTSASNLKEWWNFNHKCSMLHWHPGILSFLLAQVQVGHLKSQWIVITSSHTLCPSALQLYWATPSKIGGLHMEGCHDTLLKVGYLKKWMLALHISKYKQMLLFGMTSFLESCSWRRFRLAQLILERQHITGNLTNGPLMLQGTNIDWSLMPTFEPSPTSTGKSPILTNLEPVKLMLLFKGWLSIPGIRHKRKEYIGKNRSKQCALELLTTDSSSTDFGLLKSSILWLVYPQSIPLVEGWHSQRLFEVL